MTQNVLRTFYLLKEKVISRTALAFSWWRLKNWQRNSSFSSSTLCASATTSLQNFVKLIPPLWCFQSEKSLTLMSNNFRHFQITIFLHFQVNMSLPHLGRRRAHVQQLCVYYHYWLLQLSRRPLCTLHSSLEITKSYAAFFACKLHKIASR